MNEREAVELAADAMRLSRHRREGLFGGAWHDMSSEWRQQYVADTLAVIRALAAAGCTLDVRHALIQGTENVDPPDRVWRAMLTALADAAEAQE